LLHDRVRILVENLRFFTSNAFAPKDQGDPVRNLKRAFQVVGDRDAGDAQFTLEIKDDAPDDIGHDGVEASGGLVEEEDLGLQGDGSGKAHAALHAAGEFRRLECLGALHPHHGQTFIHTVIDFAF